MKIKRAFAALVALTLVGAHAAMGAEATKTYRSEQFKFSFDYPASWSIKEDSKRDRSQLLILRLLSRDQNVEVLRDYSPGSFAIEVFANPRRLELRTWLDEHGWPFGEGGRSVTATSVGGLPALEIATGKMYAPNRFIYVAADGVVLRVAPLAAQSREILRSLRFQRER